MFIVQVYLNLKIRYFLSFRKISETLKVVFLVKYELVCIYIYISDSTTFIRIIQYV
jgi:hypothetical protein